MRTPIDYEPMSPLREPHDGIGQDEKIAGCRENFVIGLVLVAFVVVFGGGGLFFYLMSHMKNW